MKIAMIGHKRIPSREGGVEIVVEELATKMAAEGHEVYAYNRAGHHVSGAENDVEIGKMYRGVHIITIPTSEKKSLNATLYSILATLHAIFHHYDVIHYHASGSCAMLWLPHFLGIRTVATIHGIDSQRAKWGGFATRYLEFGEKCAAKYADELIVLSEGNKQYFKERYGREATLIPNGVSEPEVQEADIITEQFGLEKDGYILFLARIVPEKGLHYLIKAYKQINTDKKLVIVGGTSHSNDYVSKIKRAARDDDRIMLLGFQQGKVLEELYSNAYLYVLPSDVEGMPISLLEAMSYGNCCLVSDINETAGVVADKGITFKQGDVEDLKNKLIQLLDDKHEVKSYKKQAAEYILSKYNWDDVVSRTINLYNCGLKAL